MRPHARRAVVLAAGRERGAMEGIDRGAVLGHEGDVDMALRSFAGREPEVGLSIVAEADIAYAAALLRRYLHGDPVAERCERLEVERLRAFVVRPASSCGRSSDLSSWIIGNVKSSI